MQNHVANESRAPHSRKACTHVEVHFDQFHNDELCPEDAEFKGTELEKGKICFCYLVEKRINLLQTS